MTWEIEYYVTENGRCPAKEFIDSLSAQGKAKYIFIADLLEEFGINVKEPYVKPITGVRKLYEIRIKDKENIHRILYFAFTGKKLVLLHGFTKKTQKTPPGELRTAQRRMEEYINKMREVTE